MGLENIIGVEKAGEILGLSPGRVKNMCAEGKLEAKKIGKTWILDKTNLEVKKMVKVMYEDILVGEILTNRSLTVDEALDLIDFNEEKFIIDNGFDDIDYNDFSLVY
ncbi:helix-turn-helix domain-containing protein [Schinkia azotoformans]|uniref:helix-turn-helix domain-containing protein n=1 Tax=Schinkia azotoformans TaxID=1454 RepID=UPI002DBE73E1|nr:helix-turn-helix domain-containing protein [Schinkia azotoformans]MEC1714775.1 helix-turn-helix domain-containing protein [Schinkia azotoformans]MEC1757469.1 helix-turn-helix domain-containing protein [Schinkia azotoformans]